jgi:DNA-binding GntR family transcriptional regulator
MDNTKYLRASDLAYGVIKKAILNGRFKHGEKLGKQAMAALCGTSVIPVVDALNRLEDEGLVESDPYAGARVADVNKEKLTDMLIMREAVEVQVARILCFTLGKSELDDLYDMAKKIDAMSGQKEKDANYNELHYRFHMDLAKKTGSKNLVDAIERLQFFTLLAEAEKKYSELLSDTATTEFSHSDIINALRRRNLDEAQNTVRRHIYRSLIIETPYWV